MNMCILLCIKRINVTCINNELVQDILKFQDKISGGIKVGIMYRPCVSVSYG